MLALDIQHLKKNYGNFSALKDINISIESGDFFALLGVNGAGKTTLIGILTDLVKKTSGTVNVFGNNLDTDIQEVKKCIGVVPQEFNFDVFMTVENILLTSAGYFGINKQTAKTRSDELLQALGLSEKKHTIAKNLSGGMKRRLMIARALMHKPKLLLLDEPTAGVDITTRKSTWKYLQSLNTQGTTILLTTHYLEEVEQLCNKVALIDNGTITLNGGEYTAKQLEEVFDTIEHNNTQQG